MIAPRILEIGMHFRPAAGVQTATLPDCSADCRKSAQTLTDAAFGSPGEEIRNGFSLGSPEAGLLDRPRAMRRLDDTISEPGRVVATHFALYALPLIGRLQRVPHVVHFHGPWAGESSREGQNRLAVAAKRLVEGKYASARRLITLSAAFRDLLCRDYGIPEAACPLFRVAWTSPAFVSRKIALPPGPAWDGRRRERLFFASDASYTAWGLKTCSTLSRRSPLAIRRHA